MTGPCESASQAGPFRETYDIIGSLPVEILFDIVKYLDPADIFLSQRVSKRWRSIFSSDSIIKFFLRETLMFLGIEDVDVPATDAMTYFMWRHRLQRVQPVKKIFLPWPETPRLPLDVAYRSRRVYYCLPGDDTDDIGMLDLETGERLTWTEDESIDMEPWDFRLSDRYLVIYSDDKSYLIVWDTRTLQRYARGLPCSDHHTSIDKDKVVIVDYGSKPLFPVYIWDLSSDRFQKINTFSDLFLWHLDADDGILVAFEIDWDKRPPAVRETKWTMTGRVVERKHFPLSLSDYRVNREILEPSKDFIQLTVDTNTDSAFGHHKTVTQLRYSDPRCGNCWISLTYDHTVDKLSARWDDDFPPVYDMTNTPVIATLSPKIMYRWDRFLKVLQLFYRELGMMDMKPYQLDAREVLTRKRLRTRLPAQLPATLDYDAINKDDELVLPIFGDREIFGVASEDGIQFWIFHPNFTPNLPNALPFLPMEESG